MPVILSDEISPTSFPTSNLTEISNFLPKQDDKFVSNSLMISLFGFVSALLIYVLYILIKFKLKDDTSDIISTTPNKNIKNEKFEHNVISALLDTPSFKINVYSPCSSPCKYGNTNTVEEDPSVTEFYETSSSNSDLTLLHEIKIPVYENNWKRKSFYDYQEKSDDNSNSYESASNKSDLTGNDWKRKSFYDKQERTYYNSKNKLKFAKYNQ
jgi:hypothetical protein